MASRTQLRLQQITGSLVNLKTEAAQYLTPSTAADLTGSDLQDVLGAMAAAIQRIHGAASDEPFNNAAGVFNQDITITGTTPTLTIGDAGEEDTAIVFDGNAVDFYMGLDDGTDKLHIGLGSTVGTTPNIVLNSADRDVTFEGNIQVAGNIVGDADEAKAIFAASTTPGNAITIGGGADVVMGGDIQLATAGLINDSGGHARLTATDAGATILGAADGTAGLTLEYDNSLVTIAGNLTVTGGDIGLPAATSTIGAALGANTLTIGQTASTVVVPGNLTVQGTTTQVDTTNLQVKDKNILVNDGGSNNSGAGAGLDIEEAGSVVGYIRVADDDRTNLDLKAPGGSELKLDINADKTITVAGALNIEADSNINQDLSTDSTSAQFAKLTLSDADGALTFSNNAASIKIADNQAAALVIEEANNAYMTFVTTDSSEKIELYKAIDVSNAGIYVDADNDSYIFSESDDVITFGVGNSDELHLSASTLAPHVDDGLALGRTNRGFSDVFLANGAVFDFNAGNVTLTHDNNKLTLLADKDLKFGADSVGISNGTDGSNPRLELTSNSQTFLFPSSRASASGQAIVGDGSGNLSFAEVGKVTTKGVYAMTASHAAQSAFKTSTNGNRVSVTDQITGLEESDAQGKNLDVYVNGQLLASGSSFTGAAAATTDYMIADATNIAFSFDLEVEDIVQIVKRG